MSVRYELQGRLQTLATSLSLPVSYESLPFTKPADMGSFLEAFVIPANTQDVSVDGKRQRDTGIFQVNVWSKTGVGAKAGEDIANAIRAAFPVVPKVAFVSIETTPTIKQAILDNSGYRIIPVVMSYRLEVSS